MSDTRGTIAIPEADHDLPASTTEDVDVAVAELRDHAKAWVDTSIDDRVAMLEQAIQEIKSTVNERHNEMLENERETDRNTGLWMGDFEARLKVLEEHAGIQAKPRAKAKAGAMAAKGKGSAAKGPAAKGPAGIEPRTDPDGKKETSARALAPVTSASARARARRKIAPATS